MELTPDVRLEEWTWPDLRDLCIGLLGRDETAKLLRVTTSTLTKTYGHRDGPPPVKRDLLIHALRAAQSVLGVPLDQILIAPEGAMSDPTFRRVWAQVAAVWRYRNTKTKDEWEALVHNVGVFSKGVAASGKPRRRATKSVTKVP